MGRKVKKTTRFEHKGKIYQRDSYGHWYLCELRPPVRKAQVSVIDFLSDKKTLLQSEAEQPELDDRVAGIDEDLRIVRYVDTETIEGYRGTQAKKETKKK